MRGAISVAFLERMERLLAETGDGEPERLADRFHLIGGTSTGAIIASALALGYSASDIRDFYLNLAPQVFRRSRFRLLGLQSVFDAAPLEREIAAIVGDRTLESPDLRTFLAIVMKRMDTGSAWLVTNNPRARYWDHLPDSDYLGNRHYRLGALIRASTAAPHFFAPEAIPILSDQPPGLFVDGGVTPHNNPALLLAMAATIPAYGFGWETGAEKMALYSIGTGAYRPTLDPSSARRMSSAGLAIRSLAGLINDAEAHSLALCQWLGECATPWWINSEMGDLSDAPNPAAPLFRFFRYNVRLERDWLCEYLGVRLSPRDLARLRQIDNAAATPIAYEIGQAAAERFLTADALPQRTAILRPAG